MALQDMYMALNNPPQLNSWRLEGGDPCGESWTGVSCSGSSVIYLLVMLINLFDSTTTLDDLDFIFSSINLCDHCLQKTEWIGTWRTSWKQTQ